MSNRNEHNSKPTLARSLGYLALGLGAAELFAGKRVARLIGLTPTSWKSRALRALGLGELVAFGLARFGRTSSKVDGRPSLRASITVEKTPADVYAFWRNFDNFPRFVSQIESVSSSDKIRSRWKAKLSNKATIEWDATIVEDAPDQRLVWKLQSPTVRLLVDTVEARFELAPGGQGTEIHLVLYGSQLEKPAATVRWLRTLPEGLLFDELHRFKQLVELGEITQSDTSIHQGLYPARPSPREEPFPEEAAFEAAPTNPNLTLGAPS